MRAAKSAVVRALELDPQLSEAHATLGFIHYMYDWDYAAGRRELDLGLSAPGHNLSAMLWKAFLLTSVEGRFDEALALSQRAAALDPLSGLAAMHVAHVLLTARRYGEAETAARLDLELEPGSWISLLLVGVSQLRRGHSADAIATLSATFAASGRHPWVAGILAEALLGTGRSQDAVALHQEQVERAGHTAVFIPVAMTAAALGRMDEAFTWLERAVEARDALPTLNHSWNAELIRRDARFADLMRRIGLATC